MRIKIICVGKLKEKYLKDAIAEYSKRLSRFCTLEITELSDEKIPDNASVSQEEQVLLKEGEKILKCISPSDYVISLCVEGTQKSSEDFAKSLAGLALSGNSTICFVIGGSLGLHPHVKIRSDMKLGFSEMTFPHQLIRVFLLEQIYRAYKINSNEKYHK